MKCFIVVFIFLETFSPHAQRCAESEDNSGVSGRLHLFPPDWAANSVNQMGTTSNIAVHITELEERDLAR